MVIRAATKGAYDLFHQGTSAFARLEENGMRIDEHYLNKTIDNVNLQISELQAEIQKSKVYLLWKRRFKDKFSWDAPAQLGKVLFGEMGFKATEFTEKTGAPKVTDLILSKIDHPVIKPYLEMKKLTKTRSTFLYGIRRELVDGYIHAFFNLAGGGGGDDKGGARTYRSSGSDPNPHNFPKRNKKVAALIDPCFIPRGKNRRLVARDFSGIEVKIAACYHQDPMMLRYIKDPTKDMHRDMAMECYMIRKPKWVSEEVRYCSKNKFVFPAFYGSYYKQMAPDLWNAIDSMSLEVNGTSLKEHLARKGIKRLGKCDPDDDSVPGTFEHHIQEVQDRFWNERFSVYNQWRRDWYDEYLKTGQIPLLTGFVIEGYYKRNDVINYPVQGSAFHCLLWCIIEIMKEIKKLKMKTVLDCQIHDMLRADVPEDELQDYLDLSDEIMVHRLRKAWPWIIVPLSTDAEVTELGGSWATRQKWRCGNDGWEPKTKRAA